MSLNRPAADHASPSPAPRGEGGIAERLSAHHDGELTADESAAVERHLADHPADRAVLRDYRRLSDLLGGLPADAPPASLADGLRDRVAAERRTVARRRTARRAAAAAAAVLALSVVAGVFLLADRDPGEALALARQEPPAPAAFTPEPSRPTRELIGGDSAALRGRGRDGRWTLPEGLADLGRPDADADGVVLEAGPAEAGRAMAGAASDTAVERREVRAEARGLAFEPDARAGRARASGGEDWRVGDLIPLADPDGGVAVVYFRVLDARRARDEVELLLSRHRVPPRAAASPDGAASGGASDGETAVLAERTGEVDMFALRGDREETAAEGELAVLVVSDGAQITAALNDLLRSDLVVAVEPRDPLPPGRMTALAESRRGADEFPAGPQPAAAPNVGYQMRAGIPPGLREGLRRQTNVPARKAGGKPSAEPVRVLLVFGEAGS